MKDSCLMQIAIRRMGSADEDLVIAARALFDNDPDRAATQRFLAEPTHHLLIAYDPAERAIGFVSGVEMTHPDKGTEMFLYELGVEQPARGQGVGRSLVAHLAALARERGCYGMWVLTEPDNVAAQRTYERAGAAAEPLSAMFEWSFRPAPGN